MIQKPGLPAPAHNQRFPRGGVPVKFKSPVACGAEVWPAMVAVPALEGLMSGPKKLATGVLQERAPRIGEHLERKSALAALEGG